MFNFDGGTVKPEENGYLIVRLFPHDTTNPTN